MVKNYLYLLLFLFINLQINGQGDWHTTSKKAIESIEEGITQMGLGNYDQALELFKAALKADKKFAEAYLMIGQLYEELKKYEQAAEFYLIGHEISPGLFNQTLFSHGRACFYAGKYGDAKTSFENFIQQENISVKSRSKALKYIDNCNFAIKAIESPLPFNPRNIGSEINTKYHEYWPCLSADEDILIYTSRIPIDTGFKGTYGNWQEDFFISSKSDSGWLPGKNIGSPLNTYDNEGAQSLSVDGQSLFFTACNREDSKGKCDIYHSIFDGESWSEPVNIGLPVNSGNNEKQPSISPDGNTLYFISERAGGMGKMDIWKSEKTINGNWGNPVNLGDSINTIEDEQSPFIHADGKTLYFTSNGRTGMGGSDIYFSRMKIDGTWTNAVNLGYPINSPGDEMGIFVNAKGNKGYFSSDRNLEMGLDIFEFEMSDPVKPAEVSYFKGKIYDADTKEKLVAHFQIIDLKTNDTVNNAYSDSKGSFLITIPAGNDYALIVTKKGYLFFSESFEFSGSYSNKDPMLKDIPLQPLKLNKQVVLKNTLYEINSYKLRNESKIELDKIIDFLSLNPNIKIEISGHTDNLGTHEYNMELSQKRSEVIIGYLINQGIKPYRLSAKGYGETIPVASNETEQGRAMNRRTELKIIGN